MMKIHTVCALALFSINAYSKVVIEKPEILNKGKRSTQPSQNLIPNQEQTYLEMALKNFEKILAKDAIILKRAHPKFYANQYDSIGSYEAIECDIDVQSKMLGEKTFTIRSDVKIFKILSEIKAVRYMDAVESAIDVLIAKMNASIRDEIAIARENESFHSYVVRESDTILNMKTIKELDACDGFRFTEVRYVPIDSSENYKIAYSKKDSATKNKPFDYYMCGPPCIGTIIKNVSKIKCEGGIHERKKIDDKSCVSNLELWEKNIELNLSRFKFEFSVGDSVTIGYDSALVRPGKIIGINQFGINALMSESDSMAPVHIQFSFENINEIYSRGIYNRICSGSLTKQQKLLYAKWAFDLMNICNTTKRSIDFEQEE